jgi:hypothetical protein
MWGILSLSLGKLSPTKHPKTEGFKTTVAIALSLGWRVSGQWGGLRDGDLSCNVQRGAPHLSARWWGWLASWTPLQMANLGFFSWSLVPQCKHFQSRRFLDARWKSSLASQNGLDARQGEVSSTSWWGKESRDVWPLCSATLSSHLNVKTRGMILGPDWKSSGHT